MGFIVSHAALSKDDGFVFFAAEGAVGVENKGISNTNCESASNNCINVTKYSLDSYMEKFVPMKDNSNRAINYLSVDVEGWDFEVLLGGKQNLALVHYLEFEYNWVSMCELSCRVKCFPMSHELPQLSGKGWTVEESASI